MTKIYNTNKNKDNRRELRRNQTKEELIFWSQVKDRRFHGYKFRRQFSIGNYIADFYCPELRLVVEIDGGQHREEESVRKDEIRTNFFEELNIKVKRYSNVEVKNNLAGVMDDLLIYCESCKSRADFLV